MASLLPISTYNLALEPFNPQPALQDEFPVTVRITMAAVDPESVDDKSEPSTLRVLKRAVPFGDDAFDIDSEDEDDEEDELDSEEEEEPKESKKEKKDKKDKKSKKEEEEEEDEDEDEDDEDDEDDLDDEVEEFVLCTLSPKVQFQQTIDFTISPSEEVHFVVTGSYPIHLSGNYVEHPADDEEDDYDSEDDYSGEEDYNLTPDEDELLDIEALEDESDVEGRIEELVEEEGSKKRAAEEEPQPTKKSKKEKKKDDKKVQFTKELEQGPTPSKKEKKEKAKEEKKEVTADKEDKKEKKFPTKTLLGGVITEDRKTGSGAAAKSGNKVGIRYIGKLKNGKIFDKNTSGKPFVFNLGKGECIKGFDLGVAGMAVGGERRVVIPPKMAYGSQKLPGIPANSELTFDIKLVSLK